MWRYEGVRVVFVSIIDIFLDQGGLSRSVKLVQLERGTKFSAGFLCPCKIHVGTSVSRPERGDVGVARCETCMVGR